VAGTRNEEEEIMPKVKQHGREQHNLQNWTRNRKKVRGAIRRKTA